MHLLGVTSALPDTPRDAKGSRNSKHNLSGGSSTKMGHSTPQTLPKTGIREIGESRGAPIAEGSKGGDKGYETRF